MNVRFDIAILTMTIGSVDIRLSVAEHYSQPNNTQKPVAGFRRFDTNNPAWQPHYLISSRN